MPDIFTENTFSEVYRDDYRDSDNYHQVLFNAGRALQGRELNQLQTILNQEVARFARNIFKEGAAVTPVQNVKVNTDYKYIKVTQETIPGGKDLVGEILTGQTSGVQAKILQVAEFVDAANPLTFYIEYTNTDTTFTTASDNEPITFSLSENVYTADSDTFTIQGDTTAIGAGTRADVGDGIFFVRDHFVFAQSQTILLSRYTSNPSTELGFKVLEDIITVDDTDALYDNQGDVPNLSSPGADRYRIRLELVNANEIVAGEDFAYVAKIVDGEVVEINNGRREYNLILDLLAQRTFEESGNYTVDPFISIFEEDPDNVNKLKLKVQPGIAYVLGYRAAPGGKTISVDKPRSTVTLEDESVSATYGNYILVDEPVGLFKIDEYQPITFRSDSAGAGTVLGTGRVRSIEARGDGKYRLYLFDVNIAPGNRFRDVGSVEALGKYANVNPDGPFPTLLDNATNNLLFSLPRDRADWEVAPNFDMVVQRVISGTTDGSGQLALATGSVDTFTSTSEWLVYNAITGDNETPPLGSFSATGGTTIQINGLLSGTTYDVYCLVSRANVAPRTKTRSIYALDSSPLDSDNSLSLQRADIISVLVTDETTGLDITDNFDLDNGQRDNYYGIGRITLKPAAPAPAGDVSVSVTFFAHSSSGGFFAASSYEGIPGLEYSDIPTYTTSKGVTVPLREVIDFRPTKDYTGAGFTSVASGGRVNLLPRNTDTITSSSTYYMPRNDILVVNTLNEIEYIYGEPSFQPEYPEVPPNAMLLYQIELGANTLGVEDTRLNYIDNRRYTMRDIGKLDRQIQENRELITLNALELDTKTLEVLDEAGLPRTKAGFFVDNFTNFRAGDAANPSFICSLDTEEGILRPHFDQKEVSLVYDSDLSTDTIRKGNAVLLKYNHELWIDQPKASGVVNVNPFNVITNNGVMVLAPSRDNWRSTRTQPRQIAPAQWSDAGWPGVNRSILAGLNAIDRNWRQWDWSWWGRNNLTDRRGVISANNGRGAADFERFLDANNVSYRPGDPQRFVARHGQLAVQVTSNGGGGRTVDQTDVPFMRSREIAVRVTGLMPFTRHYPFFDEVDVLRWCKQLTESEYDDLVERNRSDDPPVTNTEGLTERPDGFTATGITTDGNGVAYFSFLIPSNETTIFPTGTQELAIYDITSPVAANANSQAAAEYTARGIQESVTETSNTVRLRTYDPIAQSFRNALSHGVFLTKVDVFVATVDPIRPLIVEIRPLVNGSPSAIERLRYGIATKEPSEITTSGDATVATTFEFARPVYLEPNTSYALVVRSESNEYFVWQATMGQFEVGSTEKRITAQPYMGSFFASQNGETWTPQQDRDLKFKAYIADFTPSGLFGTATLNNAQTQPGRLIFNPLLTTAGSNSLRIQHYYHGMNVGDTVELSRWTTADSDIAAPTGFTPADIEGEHTITDVDLLGYSITLPANASETKAYGSDLWQATQNNRYQVGRNAVDVFQPNAATIAAYNRFTTLSSVMAGTSGTYIKDVTRRVTALQQDILFDAPYAVASDVNERDQLASEKSLDLEIDFRTSNKYISPVLNLDAASFMSIQTVIDNQVAPGSVDTTTNIIPYNFVDESSPEGGSALSKYVTKDIAVENLSTGLKILVAANVPSGAMFDMYYKIADEATPLSEKSWVLIGPETPQPTDDNPNTFREYRYIAGGLLGDLDPFTKFKVKIVMKSTNEAKYPSFKDLRAIALED